MLAKATRYEPCFAIPLRAATQEWYLELRRHPNDSPNDRSPIMSKRVKSKSTKLAFIERY
jgi:hypothetical protein